jgi:putative ABC transport system ATP-binding protein
MESIIELKNVSKTYKVGGTEFKVLDNINLTITKGEKIAITGRSGSGKSTLMNLICGIDRASSGTITVFGDEISSYSEKQLTTRRGSNAGIVFQFFQLLPTLSIIDNILLPMDFLRRIPQANRRSRAIELLRMTGIESHAKKYPAQLSGGEQQRAAIARALANNPEFIAADEPTGNLDSANSEIVKEIIKDLNKQGKTIVTITHEQVNPGDYDEVICLADGKIINQYVY